jgi:DNA (cytosine-5)-methyltransferase 1
MMIKARSGRRLPGFPLWADDWKTLDSKRLSKEAPWKADYLVKNAEFYATHKRIIDQWAKRWGVYTDLFPASRRKLEWQAQDTPSLWDAVMHFRPSGIRAKAPTYLPALVAITQTSIIGTRERRLSPREAARLQGLPDWFDFGGQSMSATYRQLGNGVSIGAVWHVLRSHVERDEEVLKWTCPELVNDVLGSPASPDGRLKKMKPSAKRRILPSVA